MRSEAGRRAAVPKYLQVADDVLEQIRSGFLRPGLQVPSESELMARYGVSVGTVRKAMTEIRVSGLVETHQGRGSFVKARALTYRKSSDRFRRSDRSAAQAAFPAEAEWADGEVRVSDLYAGSADAPTDIARRLGVDPGATVLERRRLYFSDGVPVEEATSYLRWELVDEIPQLLAEDSGPEGIYARLEEHGLEIAEFVESVRARIATKQECTTLSLSPGAAVILLTREAVSAEGQVVEVCDTVMAADRFVLEYRIQAAD
ncbi:MULTISPECIES: GntR family transcriptional regulator [unclassified Streptomyces]|uniref:GntR family transcriptional regulator n=1 Tax=unclassified Streptomyces TaxID=2593676 RepID=UPI003330AA6D